MNLPTFHVAQVDPNFEIQPSDIPDVNLVAILIPALLGFLVAFAAVGAIMWWGMFTKAGKPGWHSIIPIYNIVVWMQIIGRPGWWTILMFVPLVNLIIAILACIDTAKSFGKDAGFGVGLWLLGIIFFPILSWGGAKYQGPAASTA